ncbi:histidine kinase [Hymenobacter sp. BT186]|uniref:Histidine kinase n=1 Tax=Hymenobacter telluris TaxID=2816474 RepID=A0A939EZN1_9BACT|nr:histidine kinase [Hymenobacter telluris]MBO0360124.1 histidine kinase [Hymenobacter telluris]MBW3376151.1 histidine kinase [Hymenobacter norwichensis]
MQTSLPAAVAVPKPSLPAMAPVFRAPNSLRSIGRALRVILLMSVVISLLVNPRALHSGQAFAITYAYTVMYSTGLWLTNGYVVEWLNRRYAWTTQPLRRLLLTLAVSLGGSVLVIVLMNAVLLLLLHKPLERLWSDDMYWQILVPLIITVIISLFNHSRAFFLQWREAAVRAERLEKETAVARLDSLRRQVDPHFLFNSLNALTSLVEENDPVRAVRFIRQLSQVYRYVLDSQAQEVVSLEEEMRFVESYVFLQRTRLGEGVQVDIVLPPAPDLDTLLVPPLAIQLLLENALKHNATSQRDPLRISITLDAAARQLVVRNALRPRRLAEGESTGLGLENLRARYAFLTKQPMTVVKTATEFVVTLPVLTLETEPAAATNSELS